jgi:hypothetical protein
MVAEFTKASLSQEAAWITPLQAYVQLQQSA